MAGGRTRQPRQPRINWGNPLTRNAAFICVGESPRDLVNGLQWTPSGTTPPTLSGTPNGRAKAFTSGAATVSYLSLGAATASSTVDIADGPCTFVGVFYANSTSGVAIAERNDGNSVNLGWLVGYALGDTAKPGLAFVREYSTANLRKSISETISPGLNVLVVTHDGSNLSASVNIYLNGRLGTVFGNFDGSGTTGSDSSQSLFVGRNTFDTSHSHDGTILLSAAFKRQWSPAEVVAFSNNPWQLFTGAVRRQAVALPSGGISVNPGLGTLTLSGFAPTISQPQTAAPGVGSLTLTGFAPTVAQPQTANPGVGSLTLTGFAPTIAQPQTAAPGVGSLVLTGYAPTIAQGQSANPDVGVLNLTGYAPTISQPQTSGPGVGALSLTGFAPSVVLNTNVLPGQSSLTLTGFAPAVTQNTNVVPNVGTLALSGYAPTLTQTANQQVLPGVGPVSLTGFAPTVQQAAASQNLTPDVGLLVITGYAPSVLQRGGRIGGDDAPKKKRIPLGQQKLPEPITFAEIEAVMASRPAKSVKVETFDEDEEEVLMLLL